MTHEKLWGGSGWQEPSSVKGHDCVTTTRPSTTSNPGTPGSSSISQLVDDSKEYSQLVKPRNTQAEQNTVHVEWISKAFSLWPGTNIRPTLAYGASCRSRATRRALQAAHPLASQWMTVKSTYSWLQQSGTQAEQNTVPWSEYLRPFPSDLAQIFDLLWHAELAAEAEPHVVAVFRLKVISKERNVLYLNAWCHLSAIHQLRFVFASVMCENFTVRCCVVHSFTPTAKIFHNPFPVHNLHYNHSCLVAITIY